jgi:hypothetical protein
LLGENQGCCRKDSDSCGHCPLDPKTRVAQLIQVFSDVRGYDQEQLKNLYTKDFISYVTFRGNRCIPFVLNLPDLLPNHDITMLHEDEWMTVNQDGSVTATFTNVLISSGLTLIYGLEIVQTWIPVDGLCNYKLKQENVTDCRCLVSRK